MKVQTSVAFSPELVSHLSQVTTVRQRSAYIENAVWQFLKADVNARRENDEFDRINQCADRLNAEAMDVLSYQQLDL